MVRRRWFGWRLTLVMAGVCSGTVSAEAPVALVGGVVVDGNGGTPVENGVVVVRDGRIEAMGDANAVRVPSDARVIDIEGRAVLPGLADMHVHLMGGWDGVSSDLLGYQRYLNALLYSGVTTIFDLGNVMPYVLQLRSEVAAGTIVGPRIYCVGPLVDDADPSWPPFSVGLVTDSQVPEVIALLQRSGVDAVKAYGGLSVPLLRELVRVASESSLPVIADLWDRNGSFDVTATGIAAIAHVPTHEMDQRSFDLIVERKARVITTLAVRESFSRRRLANLAFLDQPLIAQTTPPAFQSVLRELALRDLTDEDRQAATAAGRKLDLAKENVQRLHRAGVLLVAGTDAPYPGVFQGEGIHRELELLVEAGLSPLEAITSATRNAAILVGAEDWGTLAPGNAADLIVVDGRPDRDISRTRAIHMVMQGGQILDREALRFDPDSDPGFGVGAAVDESQ
jgi:imidazolonepropionase-like amidohydrolase